MSQLMSMYTLAIAETPPFGYGRRRRADYSAPPVWPWAGAVAYHAGEATMAIGFSLLHGTYFDSVALLRVAEGARGLAGVREVALVMGTPANRAMLAEAEMLPPDAPPTDAADLLVVISADSDEAVRAALARVDELLAARRGATAEDRVAAPRTLASAARASGAASVALIAVPGPYAALEAHQALSAGLPVFLFSDGGSLDDELALKRRAR